MKRSAAIIVTALATGWASPAWASTLSLGLDTSQDPSGMRGLGMRYDGTVVIGVQRGHFLQRFAARLVADDGTHITGCLGTARVKLMVAGSTVVRAVSDACAGSDGLFEMRPVGSMSIQTPKRLVARIDATSVGGHPIRAARSNAVAVRIAPNVINESPTSYTGAGRYPVSLRIGAPAAGRRGVLTVKRRRGSGWVVVSRHVPDLYGRVHTAVAYPDQRNVFAFVFTPARGTGYIPSTTRMRIDRTTIWTVTTSSR